MNEDHAVAICEMPVQKKLVCSRHLVCALVLFGCLLQGLAHAQPSAELMEDFESLVLGPFVSEGQFGGNGEDWTDVPPPGWEKDNSTTPVGGPPEFFGWTFLDKDSWVLTEGDQRRSEFVSGVGTVMVADPDAYDDLPPGIRPDLFQAFITTPSISLAETAPGSATIFFDSSWRPDATQTATVEVSFDGGGLVEVLRWESDIESPNYKADAVDELVTIAVDNPPGTSEMSVRFGLFDAGNNWWWAIDNVSVQGLNDLIFADGFETGNNTQSTRATAIAAAEYMNEGARAEVRLERDAEFRPRLPLAGRRSIGAGPANHPRRLEGG